MSRPTFVPTPDLRLRVKMLAAVGINREAIALMVGVRSLKTLRKHFRNELALGPIEGLVQVAQTHHKMATSGKYPVSTIHYLATRSRFLDVERAVTGEAKIPDFVVTVEKKAA